jgi:integrase
MVVATLKSRSLPNPPPPTRLVIRPRWLLSPFESNVWKVSDIDGKLYLINFDWPLPDGSRLTDPCNRDQLNTIKMYAVEIRTGPCAATDDAYIQQSWVHNLIYTLYWMRRRHIKRFADLNQVDIRLLIDDAKFGAERLVDAAGRLQSFLTSIKSDRRIHELPRRPYGNKKSPRELLTGELLDMADLPRSLMRNERVAWVAARAGEELGFFVRITKKKHQSSECPENEVLNREPLRKLLRPLDDLYAMRFRIKGDNITFNPFPTGVSRLAAKLGEESGRTPTAPYELVLHLLEHSARWTLNHSADLFRLRKRVHTYMLTKDRGQQTVRWKRANKALSSSGQECLVNNVPVSVSRTADDQLHLNTALRYLATACFILIAALTARRKEEILLLEAGCISQDREGFWLEVYIAKNLREKGKIPCPELVVHAVRVLELLSAEARVRTGSRLLDQFIGADPSVVLKLGTHELNAFASFVGVPALPDGSIWLFSAHQFRRFFAIAYVWRWGGDLPSLAHHLRHMDLERVRRYLVESEAGAIFADTQRYFTYEIMSEVALGKRALGGPTAVSMSKELRHLKDNLAGRTKIIDPDKLRGAVEEWVDKSHLVLRQNPWVYCACSADQPTTEAACRHGCPGSGPNLKDASAVTCSNCVFAFTIKEQSPFLEREIELSEVVANEQKLPIMLRDAAQVRSDALRRLLPRLASK